MSEELEEWWCPKCQKLVTPQEVKRTSTVGRLVSYVFCLFGACSAPYALPPYQVKHFYCPHCHQLLRNCKKVDEVEVLFPVETNVRSEQSLKEFFTSETVSLQTVPTSLYFSDTTR